MGPKAIALSLTLFFFSKLLCMEHEVLIKTICFCEGILKKSYLVVDETIAGKAEFILYDNHPCKDPYTELRLLKIDDTYQRRGYGSLLIDLVKKISAANEIYTIKLDAIPFETPKTSADYPKARGRLLNFYRKHGFSLDDPAEHRMTHLMPVLGKILDQRG